MSDAAQGALIGGALAALAAVLVQSLNYFTQKEERQERYQVAMYDKRLAVHQEAFRWLLVDLGRIFTKADPRRDPQDVSEFVDMIRKADDWWATNCLYLDPISSRAFHGFVVETGRWLTESYFEPSADPYALYTKAIDAIKEGIGQKHIDAELALRKRARE